MHYKSILITFLFITSITNIFAQEHKTILSAPDDWMKEIIPFPIEFAKDIDLVGFEDLRFHPNWRDSTSQSFWSYTFVWYVEKGEAMTESKLTKYVDSYYDGLMKVDFLNRAGSTNPVDRTFSLFVKTKKGFSGKIRVYDNFFKKKYMVLNVKVEERFCSKMKKQIIFFRISPQDFGHEVWKMFDKVKLKVKCK